MTRFYFQHGSISEEMGYINSDIYNKIYPLLEEIAAESGRFLTEIEDNV